MDDLDRLADVIADLRRRVRALETAPRAGLTSIRHGNTRWYAGDDAEASILVGSSGDDAVVEGVTSDGEVRAYFGTIGGASDVVLYLDNPDKSGRAFTWSANLGLVGPYCGAAWCRNPSQAMDSYGRSTTTSGSYEVMWRTTAYCSADEINVAYHAVRGGATSIQVKLTAEVYLSAGHTAVADGEQTVFERTISDDSISYENTETVPTSIWDPASSPIGTLIRYTLYGRVASGAGTMELAPIQPLVHV